MKENQNRLRLILPHQTLLRFFRAVLALLAFAAVIGGLQAAIIPVPNGSFETPSVPDEPPFADPYLDSWQETAQPAYYNPTNFDNTPWYYLTGEFYNDPGDGAYIDNCNGNQCAFLQSLPGVGIFQDYNSFSNTQTNATHAFNATYNAGHPYYLTVGLIGGGGGMPSNATLQISFYYRDVSNNMVTVAARTITNTTALFPTNTHFVDFQVNVPTVQPGDAWAGQKIGIQFLCTVGFDQIGGYWDVDNVRLVEGLNVPNFSFETPAVPDEPPFADPYLDYWEETPQPAYYNPTNFDNTPWYYLTGEFYNDPADGAYIDNCDSNQCAFLQSLPGVGIFQDYNSFSNTQTNATHAFNDIFNPGKTYSLTVGVIGGGGGMPDGATLQLSLYYLDASNNMVTVGAATVTNNASLFPTNTHFVDCALSVPAVKTTDPWAGQYIGIELLCTVGFGNLGGYWDVDNVRLTEDAAPTVLTNAVVAGGRFTFTLQSAPGLSFAITASTSASLSLSNWTTIGTLTNTTGSIAFTDPATNLNQRFYRARQL